MIKQINKSFMGVIHALLFTVSVLLFIVFSTQLSSADADNFKKQLTRKEMKQAAVDLFSVKCGIPREELEKSEYSYQFDVDEGLWTVWIERFAVMREGHWTVNENPHVIAFDSKGTIVYWMAHSGFKFRELDPDYINMGTEAVPLKTDAQEEDILAKVRSDLYTQYKVKDADAYSFQTKFMRNDCFTIPVWIVYIYDREGRFCWKAAYSYRGDLFSLVTAEQDFLNYAARNESFLATLSSEDVMNTRELIRSIGFRSSATREFDVPDSQAEEWMKIWIPKYREWLRDHPYSKDERMEKFIDFYPQFAHCGE